MLEKKKMNNQQLSSRMYHRKINKILNLQPGIESHVSENSRFFGKHTSEKTSFHFTAISRPFFLESLPIIN